MSKPNRTIAANSFFSILIAIERVFLSLHTGAVTTRTRHVPAHDHAAPEISKGPLLLFCKPLFAFCPWRHLGALIRPYRVIDT